jgi:hypothetical protein
MSLRVTADDDRWGRRGEPLSTRGEPLPDGELAPSANNQASTQACVLVNIFDNKRRFRNYVCVRARACVCVCVCVFTYMTCDIC